MSEDSSALVARGVEAVSSRIADFPKTVIVLGSGLGGFAAALEDQTLIPYGEIPGFSRSTVVGHSGNLIAGTIGGARIAVMQGRIHSYEGHSGAAIATPIRILRKLGVERLILTNAAGGLNLDMSPGSLMLIEDHINFSGFNPLIGPNDETVGPRFPDMSEAWDRALRAKLEEAAARAGVTLKKGVYVFVTGPNFETAAEVRMFGALGGQAVGMSTVPECLVARHCGMKVAGVSIITNFGTGLATQVLTHHETLDEAAKASEKLTKLLQIFAPSLVV